MRGQGAWMAHQEFLKARPLLQGRRVGFVTGKRKNHHIGVVVAMLDDGAWLWFSALSRLRYESSSHRKNSHSSPTGAGPMCMVRVESTNGVVLVHNECTYHARMAGVLTMQEAP